MRFLGLLAAFAQSAAKYTNPEVTMTDDELNESLVGGLEMTARSIAPMDEAAVASEAAAKASEIFGGGDSDTGSGMLNKLDPFGTRRIAERAGIYRFTFEQSHLGKMFVRSDHTIAMVNERLMEETGHHLKSKLIGTHVCDLLPLLSEDCEAGGSLISSWFENPYPLVLGLQMRGAILLTNPHHRPKHIPAARKVLLQITPYEYTQDDQADLDLDPDVTLFAFVEITFLDDFLTEGCGADGCPLTAGANKAGA